jgi:hypothetical protein
MRTLSRLHDPIIRERIREWDGLRERGEKREVRDFLDALVSLVDSQGRPFLSFDEIKAQTAVRKIYSYDYTIIHASKRIKLYVFCIIHHHLTLCHSCMHCYFRR